MNPIIVLPPKMMAPEDIKMLRDNSLCVVICEDPSKLKFLDPIPAAANRSNMENAAIGLSRILLNGQWGNYSSANVLGRSDFARLYMDCLIKGSPLDPRGSPAELEAQIYEEEKRNEIRKIAREDARSEKAKKVLLEKAEKK